MAHEEVKAKLDKYHYHEILDRLSIQMANCSEHLLNHPVGKVEREVKQNVDKAIEYLWIAYQAAGNIVDKRFKDE